MMKDGLKGDFIKYLSQFVTKERQYRMDEVLKNRTRYVTVVLEDIYQPHNASAVLRSCDCFGIQDVHIIENRNTFRINPEVTLGSSNWLNIHRYNKNEKNSQEVISLLKNRGYSIVATSLRSGCVELRDFNIEKGPFALFFGTELTGLSADVLNHADLHLKIPMHGFTESLNISVSAGIILYAINNKLINANIQFRLTDMEKNEIKLQWLKNSVKSSDSIEKEFYKQHSDN